MKSELLFNFRTLRNILEISAQEKVQGAYIQKSYRGFFASRLRKNVFYKALFFLENFRIFLFSILKMNITGDNNEAVYLVSTQNQMRQMVHLQDIFVHENYILYDLQNDKPYNFKFLKYIFPIMASLRALVTYFFRSNSNLSPVELSNRLLTVCFYAFFKELFTTHRPKAVIVANDHSRIPLGFAGAARSLGIKTIYTQHAHIAESLPKLRFDIALLYGQCAADIYNLKGQHKCKIIFRGQEGKENKMDLDRLDSKSFYCVGLFLNLFNEETLSQVLKALESNHKINKIIIRAHPAYPINKDFSQFNKVSISSGKNSLEQDCQECDFVVGGNSSFHLSVLKYGVPTLYYDAIDDIDEDYYGFLKHKICYEVKSINDINFSDAIDFYRDSGWCKKFSYLDAGYLLNQQILDENIYKEIKGVMEQKANNYP